MDVFLSEMEAAETNMALPENEFIVDSGTNFHMCNSKSYMIDFTPYHQAREVRLNGKRTLSALGFGTIRVAFLSEGGQKAFELKNVLFVPRLRRNLDRINGR